VSVLHSLPFHLYHILTEPLYILWPCFFFGRDADIAADLLFTSDISENESYFWSDELNFDNLLNNKPTSETTRYLKYQTKAGQPIGLSFILDPEINETFCSSHDSYGFRV